jgi:hypothetical protein
MKKPKTNAHDRDRRTLDIITREVGLLEMEDGHVTPEDRRWAESVVASMDTKIAEYRRSRLPKSVPIKKAEPLSERLLAMPRKLLEPLFASLAEKEGPQVQFAYRHLETLSDNDLRRMIQTIETHTKQG